MKTPIFNYRISHIDNEISKAMENVKIDKETLKHMFSCIDLTSLNTSDNYPSINTLTQKVNDFPNHYPDMPNVAAICVYPNFAETVKTVLTNENVSIAAVAGGFPSSQTFLSVKLAECEIAANKGADELDIVLSLGQFLDNNLSYCINEISLIKQTIGNKHLKVILESGLMENPEMVYQAGYLSLKAGADFIKTSTGKDKKSADTYSMFAMCRAVKDFYEETGDMKGVKPAGGISTPEDALKYYAIVKYVLGNEFLNNQYFRIGASRLANKILSEIYQTEINYF
jgi:deoxyribose-phosphate aldolase